MAIRFVIFIPLGIRCPAQQADKERIARPPIIEKNSATGISSRCGTALKQIYRDSRRASVEVSNPVIAYCWCLVGKSAVPQVQASCGNNGDFCIQKFGIAAVVGKFANVGHLVGGLDLGDILHEIDDGPVLAEIKTGFRPHAERFRFYRVALSRRSVGIDRLEETSRKIAKRLSVLAVELMGGKNDPVLPMHDARATKKSVALESA